MPVDKVTLDSLSMCWFITEPRPDYPESPEEDMNNCLMCGAAEHCSVRIGILPQDKGEFDISGMPDKWNNLGYYRKRFHGLWHNEGEPNV
jgi:hypothetical protein